MGRGEWRCDFLTGALVSGQRLRYRTRGGAKVHHGPAGKATGGKTGGTSKRGGATMAIYIPPIRE
jgi:hypothetical protein